MLISDTATVKWNSKNKRHYTDLGYCFTKMGDTFSVKVGDLTNGSAVPVIVECDYCGEQYEIKWGVYLKLNKASVVNKDCCKKCAEIKAHEVLEKKYGGYSGMYAASNEKRSKTNKEKYGSENVFGSNIIKERIVKKNMEKYGVPYTQQCKDIRCKTEATCLAKYGVPNYIELFKGKFIKDKSPVWKGGAEVSRVERATYEYRQWRSAVFARDSYSCKKCGARNGNGIAVELHAHHIKNWKDNKEARFDVGNGVTLCDTCHMDFHNRYGKRNNTQAQLESFLFFR